MSIYALDDQGNRTKLKGSVPNDNTGEREDWYAEAVKTGRPTWSKIYQWQDKEDILSISFSYPVYDQKKQFLGVIGIDLILSQISIFLRNLEVSRSSETFVMERNGLLVANSSNEPLFRKVNNQIERLTASESTNLLIRSTAEFLAERFGDLQKISTRQEVSFAIEGKRQFVQVTPWRDPDGLDWLIVVVIPEADFMGQINTNNYTTIWLCLGALAIAFSSVS
ncbi:MAG: hypothetical protein HC772_08795 [Leptolyngbyaceae cyanobacterium CRU_2_3]|nr:hypothetical protein [Leptolyngbyaceae cyanobacterium CRU_2_3]